MKALSRLLATLVLLTGCLGFAQHNHTPGHSHHDPSVVHGMLMFGTENIYLSHLPMFHSPHNYQIVLKVEISPEAQALYLKAKEENPSESVFTLVPEPFVLPEMIKAPQPFKATIFVGHFERGGKALPLDVTVNITEVIYFKKLNPVVKKPHAARYIYFGGQDEFFGVHIISGLPDFDQVVEVGASKNLVELLSKSTYLQVELVDHYPAGSPVKAGSSPTTMVLLDEGELQLDPYKIGHQIYLEFGDLSL